MYHWVHFCILLRSVGKRPEFFSCRAGQLRFFIFFRRNTLLLFKNADKIAQVIEPAAISNFRDRKYGVQKSVTRLFHPVIVQIFDRRAVCQLLKKAAEIARGHLCLRGNLFQRHLLAEMLLNIGQRTLELHHLSPGCPAFFGMPVIIAVSQNGTEQPVKRGQHQQSASSLGMLHHVKQFLQRLFQGRVLQRQKRVHRDFAVEQLLQHLFGRGVFQHQWIKNDALITAVPRHSAVKHAAADHDRCACWQKVFLPIQRKCKGT